MVVVAPQRACWGGGHRQSWWWARHSVLGLLRRRHANGGGCIAACVVLGLEWSSLTLVIGWWLSTSRAVVAVDAVERVVVAVGVAAVRGGIEVVRWWWYQSKRRGW